MSQTFNVEVGTDVIVAEGIYEGEFREFAGPIDGDNGPYYTLKFDGKDDKTYIGFADKPKGPPKVGKGSNRLGRFLAGLAGKPPTEAFTIKPDDYIGKRYMLVYGPNKNGKIALLSFTPIK